MNPPAQPIVLPARPRLELVLVHLLGAMLLAPLAAALSTLVSPMGPPFAIAAVFALTAWSAARQWRDRLELHADRCVAWRNGRAREIALDDVANVAVSLFDPRSGFAAAQQVTVTVTPRRGPAAVARGYVSAVEPGLTALAAALAARMGRRLDGGETLTFTDRARFSPVVVVGGGFVALAFLGVFAAALARPLEAGNLVTLLRVGGVLAFFGWGAIQWVRRWRASRKSGGLAVSERGVLPLSEVRPDAAQAGGYRDAYGAAAAWIPWGDIASSALDGYGLTLRSASRAEPIALTAQTDNLFVLDRLLTERIQRARGGALWESPTGVRVAEEIGGEPASVSAEAASATGRAGGGRAT